ncbi:MAG: hypothetical protein LBS96_04645 [Oscillospiraceae bacterium]|jgi:MraZ protein|nr:hypothetical protein [Oscillospiraceae bacterium]
MAFQGTAEGTVDAKGRVCVPAKFREGFGQQNQVMLWYSGNAQEPFLMLAAREEYNRVFRREYKNAQPAQRAQVMRKIQVNSEPVDLDKSIRFGLPEKLAAKAGIRREDKIFFIGCHTYIEIWQLGNWNAQEDGAHSDEDDAPVRLDFAPDPEWLFDSVEGNAPAQADAEEEAFAP